MEIYFSDLELLVKDGLRFYSKPLGKTKGAKEKLDLAIHGDLKLNKFPNLGVGLQLENYAWVSAGEDRNWWWQIQALPFLNWYTESYSLYKGNELDSVFNFVQNALLTWFSNATVKDSPLLWHDHATAFRFRNVINWILFVASTKNQKLVLDNSLVEKLVQFINEHISFLLDESNYSKFTNHGFDQMFILYRFCLLNNSNVALEKVAEVAKQRLLNELNFSFTSQGVHKENSPGYQKYMITRLNDIIGLGKLGDVSLTPYATEMLVKANQFLNVITLPNGMLPIIGDTEAGTQGGNKHSVNGIAVFDYSESGYVVFEGVDKRDKHFHLIFKCGHLSDYHRHDDDLLIHLFYDNEVVFGDGGIGFYQESDYKRVLLRSSCSHSTVIPQNKTAIRKCAQLERLPSIIRHSEYIYEGISYLYGVKVSRTLDVSKIEHGIIQITDQVDNPSLFSVNWYTPCPRITRYSKNKFIFSSCTSEVSVSIDRESCKDIFLKFGISDDAIISEKYGEFKDTTRFGWDNLDGVIKTKIAIN